MERVLETDRLLLRPLEPGDRHGLLAYAADPATMRFVAGGPLTADRARALAAGGDGPHAAAVLKDGGRLVGHLPFDPWFAPRIWEVGWVFAPAHRGRGLATEAAAALLGHAFGDLGVHRVVATCRPENAVSWRVMEKLGMAREAHFRRCVELGGGGWGDEYLYAILEDEWFARAGGRG